MRVLSLVTFECGKLPDGWIEWGTECTFERGALRSGRVTTPKFILPGNGWRRLRVEISVEPIGGAMLSCSDGTLTLVTDLQRSMHRIGFYGPGTLAMRKHSIPKKDGPHAVAFEFDHGRLRVEVDGVEVVSADDPRPACASGLFTLEFREDCLVHSVRILGDEPLDGPVFQTPSRSRSDFQFEVNVDFWDDVAKAPWTAAMFDELFAEFSRWGVKRCHWIHYGNRTEGWWDGASQAGRNAAITMDNVGEIFPAATRAAHAHGVEIYAMLKPFDMGLPPSYGDSTPEAARYGKLRRIGGPKSWVANFPAQHRELLMARKPNAFGPALNEVFTRIDLVKDDEAPAAFTVADLRLFVSDDNATYRPYNGPLTRQEVVEEYPVWEHTASGGRRTGETRRARVMRLNGLDIRSKYVVVRIEGATGSFSNTLINLLHVFGEKGEERRITLGMMARHGAADPATGRVPTFEAVGIQFDMNSGPAPCCVYPGYDPIRAPHALDAGSGFLAFARGKDSGPIAVLSPSFPQVREWWLSWLADGLKAGADGIELRMRSHNFNLTWAEFGFEPPVVEAFKERYGVDLLATDDFDRAAWRRLRGEGYTEFLRQARRLATRYGKPMGLHISPTLNMEPAIGGAMDIHWDWRTWLDEGLADSVTMKEVWPATRFAQEVLAHTRPRGIATIFCPYANVICKKPGAVQRVAEWIRLARQQGYDGYQFYENAAIVDGTADGRIVVRDPAMRELFQREFAGRAP